MTAGDAASRRGARALLTVASLAVMLAAADTYVVVLALPDMMAGAGLGIDALQRGAPIVSGFLLGYVAVLPLIGRLADLVPRRTILLWCLLVFVVGSAVTAVAVELPVMVGGRFLQGLGGGGLVPATLALVADLWPPGRRGTPLGVVGAVQEMGSVLGPLLGAAVLAVTSWRGIFWLNVALGLAFVAGVWALRPAPQPGTADPAPATRPATRPASGHPGRVVAAVAGVLAAGLGGLALTAPGALVTSVAWGGPFVPLGGSGSRLLTPVGLAAAAALLVLLAVTARSWLPVLLRADLWGAVLVAVALGSLVLTFASADPAVEVLGPWGLWLLPVGAAATVGLALRQRYAAAPLVPAGVVRARVVPALVVSVLVGAAIVAVVVDVPLLARLDGRTGQTGAALVLLRFLVAVPVGAVAGGMLLRRVGPGAVAAPGLLVAAVALAVMSGWDRTSLDAWLPTTLPLVAAGLGVGLAIAPVNDAALADARHDAHATVSSLVVVARMVGMVVGLAVLTAVGLRRFHQTVAGLADPTDAAAVLDAAAVQVQTVLAGAAWCALAAALVALALGLRSHRGTMAS